MEKPLPEFIGESVSKGYTQKQRAGLPSQIAVTLDVDSQLLIHYLRQK